MAEPTPGRGRQEALRSHQAAAGWHGPTPDGRAARRPDRLAGQAEPGRFAAETRAAENGAFRGNGGVESWSEGGWRSGRAVGRAFGRDGMWIVRAARIGLAVRVGRVGVVTAERGEGQRTVVTDVAAHAAVRERHGRESQPERPEQTEDPHPPLHELELSDRTDAGRRGGDRCGSGRNAPPPAERQAEVDLPNRPTAGGVQSCWQGYPTSGAIGWPAGRISTAPSVWSGDGRAGSERPAGIDRTERLQSIGRPVMGRFVWPTAVRWER